MGRFRDEEVLFRWGGLHMTYLEMGRPRDGEA